MMRRILHIADTHVGYSAYRKIDEETGLNQREVDVYNTFEQFIDYALKEKPDVILHAGDLFDSVRPTNRAISFVLSHLIRLSEAGIPFVVISGNHETPRLKETGSVFSLFEHIPHVYLIYKDKYEIVKIDDIKIHAIPHCNEIKREKRKIKLDFNSNNFNLALIHASVAGTELPNFMMGEFNEQIINIDDLINFDYVALGHFHRFTKVREDAYYAGSTERFSFNEVSDKKGFLEVRLRANGEQEIEFHELRTREMVDLEPIPCDNLDEKEIKRAIKHRISDCDPQDKIVRLRVQDIPMYIYHSLNFNEIKRLTRSAVHFEMRYEFKREKNLLPSKGPRFDSLYSEFEKFIGKYKVGIGVDKKKLKELWLKYIRKWEWKEEGAGEEEEKNS